MSKKSFSGGLSSLIREEPEQPGQGRGKASGRIITKTSQKGTREGYTRATFVVSEALLEKVKGLAYWESYNISIKSKRMVTVTIKEIVNKALQDAVDLYEKENGPIKPIPNN